MMGLMNMMMYSCRKATELMEKKNHVSLAPLEKFKLYIHTGMCDACRTYEKQSLLLEELLKRNSPDQSRDPKKTLPADVKAKIISDLEKK